ncbi:MAG TPA: metal ABC transporter permease [Spirochaetales bacterium]|nr:metal ABC transporter permease [Spirochaetales bacterium]
MKSFIDALVNPVFPFLRNAVFAGILSSVLFGILGSIITVRRIGGLAGAISHAVLGGIGLALFLSRKNIVLWFSPLIGALLFAVLSALIIGVVSLKAKQREDTIINAVWALGMSIGILFLNMTPGYADPMTYLFGNILLVSTKELVLLAVLDVVLIIAVTLFYPFIEASSFDEEFARVRGIPVVLIYFSILLFSAVAIVLVQTYIGIIMVIAMLVLPAGTLTLWVKSLLGMMVGAALIACIASTSGVYIAWITDKPAGSIIVLITGILFSFSMVGGLLYKKLLLKQRKNLP